MVFFFRRLSGKPRLASRVLFKTRSLSAAILALCKLQQGKGHYQKIDTGPTGTSEENADDVIIRDKLPMDKALQSSTNNFSCCLFFVFVCLLSLSPFSLTSDRNKFFRLPPTKGIRRCAYTYTHSHIVRESPSQGDSG